MNIVLVSYPKDQEEKKKEKEKERKKADDYVGHWLTICYLG